MTATLTATTTPDIRIGACVACKTVYRVQVDTRDGITYWPSIGGETGGYCGCRAHLGFPDTRVKYGQPVEVTYAPEVTCGARCYTAKSSTCTCSCRGGQHGLAHQRERV